jgi:hypothetical protein
LNNNAFRPSGEVFYGELVKAAEKLSRSGVVTSNMNKFCKKLHNYIDQPTVPTPILRFYKRRERQERKQNSQEEVSEEAEIAAN